jgi:GT2 family glycosyltransferase
LYSVQKACAGIEAEVWVVDNNSTDGSKEYLSPKFPWVKFKWGTTNDGFGKASNAALKDAKGEHVLFLNPDTIIPEDCFEKCLSFFDNNPKCGALGVRMLDGSGRYLKESKRGFPSPSASFFKMTGLAALFPSSKIFAGYYAGHLLQNENNEVEVLAGAFMMLSKNAVEATQGFDEDFFMYGEDVDLSFRIRQAGMINYYFAGTSILHFKGESTQKISAEYIKYFYGAMLLFVKKHFQQKKLPVFFMNMAIHLSKDMAILKMKLAQVIANKVISSVVLNTAVLANQQQFNNSLQLIKHACPQVLLAGRIAIDSNDNEAAIGNLSDLKVVINKNNIGQLVICEGDISYKNIIREVEYIENKPLFLFHANGSDSIIGSNDKNAKGFFISRF